MLRRFLGNRFSRGLAAALLVAAVCADAAAAAPQPSAGKALIVMGDSFTANGSYIIDDRNCPQGPTSWPDQLAGLMGVAGTSDFENVSCSGASLAPSPGAGYLLVQEALKAVAAGSFGPRTKVVAIQMGLNDVWGSIDVLWAIVGCVFGVLPGCGPMPAPGGVPDYDSVTGARYAQRAREVVDYVRYYAPSARIVFVGYPLIFPAHQDMGCTSVFGQPVIQRARPAVEYLDRLDAAQREAAAALRVDYFDSRAVTAGHDLCSVQPWLRGWLDPHGEQGVLAMPMHPTIRSDAAVATALYRQLHP